METLRPRLLRLVWEATLACDNSCFSTLSTRRVVDPVRPPSRKRLFSCTPGRIEIDCERVGYNANRSEGADRLGTAVLCPGARERRGAGGGGRVLILLPLLLLILLRVLPSPPQPRLWVCARVRDPRACARDLCAPPARATRARDPHERLSVCEAIGTCGELFSCLDIAFENLAPAACFFFLGGGG